MTDVTPISAASLGSMFVPTATATNTITATAGVTNTVVNAGGQFSSNAPDPLPLGLSPTEEGHAKAEAVIATVEPLKNPLPEADPAWQLDPSRHILKHFEYGHLPLHLAAVSLEFHTLAHKMAELLPPGPERSAGLRKLLEAKDCAVRAANP